MNDEFGYLFYRFIKKIYKDELAKIDSNASDFSYYDVVRKCSTSQFNKNCFSLLITIDESLYKMYEFCMEEKFTPKIYITKNCEKEKIMPYKMVCATKQGFFDYIDLACSKELATKHKMAFDYEAFELEKTKYNESVESYLANVHSLPLDKLTYDKTEIAHLCGLVEYSLEDTIKACEYGEPTFNTVSGSLISNKRMWIPYKDGKFLVISKNPADVMWASQGNGFESCYSLRSKHGGIQACMAQMTQLPWFCMAYITDGSLREFSLFRKKWDLPQMDARCWCYMTRDNKFFFDRMFGNNVDFVNCIRLLDKPNFIYINKHNKIELNINIRDYLDIIYKYRTYKDSIYTGNCDTDVMYIEKECLLGYSKSWAPKFGVNLDEVSNVPYNPDLDYKKPFRITIDRISNYYISPKSNMMTYNNDCKHWVDKYLERNVKSCIVITLFKDLSLYRPSETSHEITSADSKIRVDRDSSGIRYLYMDQFKTEKEDKNSQLLINNAKEWIKSDENIWWDCVVFRIIEDDKITIRPIYAKPNQIGEIHYARAN